MPDRGAEMAAAARGTNERHPVQWLSLVIGVVFTLVGVAGFTVTGVDGFADPDGALLFGIFEVNPLHNIVHLLIGLAGIALWSDLQRARVYGWLLAIGYGATLVYGLAVADSDDPANVLALNQADNWLHAVSALAGLAIALWPAHRASATPRRDDREHRDDHEHPETPGPGTRGIGDHGTPGPPGEARAKDPTNDDGTRHRSR
jgi:hypothetical protein